MKLWPESIDSADVLDFEIDCSDLLETGESISSYSVEIPAESSLFGLVLGTGTRAPTINGKIIKIWLSCTTPVAETVTLPVETTIVTDSSPQRTRQRTAGIKVEQR